MSEHFTHTLRQWSVLLVLFLVLLISVEGAMAWTPPTQAPAAANASPFLHAGPDNQVKDGSFGVTTAVVDQLCFGADCKTTWPTPNCRVCVAAGTANGPLAAEGCASFDNSVAYSGKEDGSNGRGTAITVRVLCP